MRDKLDLKRTVCLKKVNGQTKLTVRDNSDLRKKGMIRNKSGQKKFHSLTNNGVIED